MKRWALTCTLLSTAALMGCSGADGSEFGDSQDSLSRGRDNSRLSQGDLNRLGRFVELKFEVIENIPAQCPPTAPWGLCVDAKIVLENDGSRMNDKGWSIYYSGIRRVIGVGNADFEITHINGDLHEIKPTDTFDGFDHGETVEIPIQAEYWMISETDVMPRFYVAAPGLRPVTIDNTDTEDLTSFVAPFTTPEQLKRTPGDASVIATAGTRFDDNAALEDLGANAVASEVIPSPMNVTAGSGTLDLSRGITLNVSGLDRSTVHSVAARMLSLGVWTRFRGGTPVNVSVNPDDSAFAGKASAEAYRMTIGGSGVEIVGGDAAGAFYGLQTLMGLLPGDKRARREVPQLSVDYDAPRYSYRGIQLDLSRNFHGIDSVMKVLDQMAAYKVNTLHLHLADDEGWRLEIPGLPELTSVGARRCHDLSETHCLLPQLGSGPDTDSSGTGHLSRRDFVRILRAATARHIEVIPEFDMPGHARAAIKAMDVRAANGDSTYRLSDPDDASQYKSIQNYTDNAMNGCMDSTYAFIEKVMDEVVDMYGDAGAPLKTWHVGGDEVGAGAWTASPICETLYASGSEVASAADVHGYFVKRVNDMAIERGFGIRGWSDGMRKTVVDDQGNASKVFLDPETDLAGNAVSANWWGTLFWWDNAAYTLANLGYKVVLTSPDFLYLDHPYEADPKERGYYWATRFTDVQKLFSYIPGNLPANSQISLDRQGFDYSGAFAGVIDLEKPENIIGMEAPLWGETVRTGEQLEYMIFPRALAFAERAWHRAGWEPADGNDQAAFIDVDALAADWERFANTLGHKELKKLDRADVSYRIEVPGARIQDGKLEANVAAPGLTIQYKDGRGRFRTYDPNNPPSLSSTEVRAVTSTGRAGRSVAVN